MNACGIYVIRNIVNNKRYIGSSLFYPTRWMEHKRNLINNKHENPYLQNSWNKYGESNFEFQFIESWDENSLISRELEWINFYNSWAPKEYNICFPARPPSAKGRIWSEVSRQKISLARKGKYLSEEHKKKLSEAKKGTMRSDIIKKKISEGLKGIQRSIITTQKMSECKKGNKNPMFGRIPWNKQEKQIE